ncbi:probable alpha,alpha-trehalose-phosphate synthase [UDP-forming] 7 [Brassica napus]|uniref:probable alpha,alpha-trehalose-phosphate synthase [UDP-forming] 7 n=1 Tax=Brassica napus TaxID=3708 RepID=UPI0020787BBD|nr:probable alpha,alpha-trehalose-phosphate synthase [UDP-forming] 7 [Brassica napus]
MEVLYVGSLSRDVDSHEQEHVAQILLEKFKCVPTFLPPDLRSKYYDRFCKRQLWSLFHYMLPFSPSNGGIFDRSMWEAYVAANKLFFQKVIKVINPDDDFIYRSLPIREEILKVLLNSDLIGFHTFDYARHFLTCCSRILGLEYQSKRGYIGLEYYGRTVGIKIMPVGIDMGRIQSVMIDSEEEGKVMELRRRYEGKTVLLGIDDMDIFRGINLKLLAMEQMLKQHSTWRGRAVLVQIVNLARDKGIDIEKTRGEIEETCRKINEEFGYHQPIVYIDTPISITEINAYYHIAECVVITAVRDGMNLTPYEYIVCRQGAKKSVLVASEFIGCSPSLSRAIRVNPWNVEATGEALNEALSMSDGEKQLRHKKHYRYGQQVQAKALNQPFAETAPGAEERAEQSASSGVTAPSEPAETPPSRVYVSKRDSRGDQGPLYQSTVYTSTEEKLKVVPEKEHGDKGESRLFSDEDPSTDPTKFRGNSRCKGTSKPFSKVRAILTHELKEKGEAAVKGLLSRVLKLNMSDCGACFGTGPPAQPD